jgi:predicted amidohydrolase
MELTIACGQLSSIPYENAKNLEKADAIIKEAAVKGAKIIILPEVFNPGYDHADDQFKHAETMDGPTIKHLVKLASDLNVYITGGLTERGEKDFFNTMFFIGPTGLMAKYHKKYVFSFENRYWKRGKDVCIVDTEFGSIGLGICADMHYPRLWRQYANKVDLILICSAWPLAPTKFDVKYGRHEEQLCKDLPVHISRVFQVPVAYCNASHDAIGEMSVIGHLTCQGNSKIVDKGQVIAAIESRGDETILGTVHVDENRPEVEMKGFKNWIKYSFREIFLKFLVERFSLLYAIPYYHRHKKKYLKIRD